jgi:hypothetical protein
MATGLVILVGLLIIAGYRQVLAKIRLESCLKVGALKTFKHIPNGINICFNESLSDIQKLKIEHEANIYVNSIPGTTFFSNVIYHYLKNR